MSRFLTDLVARKQLVDTSFDRRGTWRLELALEYESDLLGDRITVPVGFVTDFASVPRLPVAHLLTANTGHAAAVLHDWAYTTQFITRRQADDLFAEALEVGGEPAWRRGLMWLGVRVGGWNAWDAHGQAQPRHVQQVIDWAHPDGP